MASWSGKGKYVCTWKKQKDGTWKPPTTSGTRMPSLDHDLRARTLREEARDGAQPLDVVRRDLSLAGPTARIHLTAERAPDGSWILGVRDAGIGIHPKHAAEIFRPFRRLHAAEKYPGTGIGLAIARKAVDRHGGRLCGRAGGSGRRAGIALPIHTRRCSRGGRVTRNPSSTRWAVVRAAFFAAALFATLAARAQEEPSPSRAASDIAEEFSDPLTTLPQFFLQDAYTLELRHRCVDQPGDRSSVRSARSQVLAASVRAAHPAELLARHGADGQGEATRTEFGDMQLFDLAVIPWPGKESGLFMGVGPVFVFPTATHRTRARARGRSAQPSARSTRASRGSCSSASSRIPSRSPTRHADRAVSTLLVQPILFLPLARAVREVRGRVVGLELERGHVDTLPLSFGVGYVILREGCRRSTSSSAGSGWPIDTTRP